jgi:GTP cyclohydrolase IA
MTDPEQHLAAFLSALGFNGDPEMKETARRFSEFMGAFVPEPERPILSQCAMTQSGPIALREMPFHSLCAHHLLPFFGTVSVAYLPNEVLAGLGSVPRALRYVARRPQLQERLTEELADFLFEALKPVGLVVSSKARHLCVEMRGSETPMEVLVVARRGETAALSGLVASPQ